MANASLFKSHRGVLPPAADTVNEAGARAYAFSPEAALAQVVMTGSLSNAFYASAEVQLTTLVKLAGQVDPLFLAKTAVFARKHGYMKDTPAVLVALLTLKAPDLARWSFERVIDNGRMLRNFVQILRSGVLGRKSLGTAPKRLVQRWLESRSVEQLLNDAVGQSPSVADILKMVHPRPINPEREAFYGWLIGRRVKFEQLPESVRSYEAFKAAAVGGETRLAVPSVNYQLLTALPLTKEHWIQLARHAPWHTLRMNLNTYIRHGVFDGEVHQESAGSGRRSTTETLVDDLAAKLADPEQIMRARVFPFQLLATLRNLDPLAPDPIREALATAMDRALANVPELPGQVYVLADVSGSMGSPITGHRKGATTKVRCCDVVGLVTSALLRKNPSAEVIAFDHQVWPLALDPLASVVANTRIVAKTGGGGTTMSAPLAWLNQRRALGDVVIYLTDNESWCDPQRPGATETLREWEVFRRRNPKARLVCIDLQPYTTSQAPARDDVLNIGGFSDAVFNVLAQFARGQYQGDHWVEAIQAI